MNKSKVAIAAPCGARWEDMTPDGDGRLCASCDKVVHDLSSLSEQRAKRLLASHSNLCVRYLFDEHGNIWFAGDRPPLTTRLLNRAKRGAVAAVAIAAPFALQACMGAAPNEEPVTQIDAGDGDPHDPATPGLGDSKGDAGAIDSDSGADDAGDVGDAGENEEGDAGDGGG